VTNWIRGEESLVMLEPRYQPLGMLGLGNSVGTPPEGITGTVIVVSNYTDLAQKASQGLITGNIVLYNAPFTTYGATVTYRTNGPSIAASYGAIACLVRSITPYSLYTPHTGSVSYNLSVSQIPAAAVTIEDAIMFQVFQNEGTTITVTLIMLDQILNQTIGYNLIGEIQGSELPNEYVVIGGHIDSWDVGTGASDDGVGIMTAWEIVRIVKSLGLKPKRTMRVVMFADEESGLIGANAYVAAHKAEFNQTVLAMEADTGMVDPNGIQFSGTSSAYNRVRSYVSLMNYINAPTTSSGLQLGQTPAGVSDLSLLGPYGVPLGGVTTNATLYFYYHHTNADTIDKITVNQLQLGTAYLAMMGYCAADDAIPLNS